MTKDEALKLALEALKNSQDYKQGRASMVEAVEDIEEALAQQEQEPSQFGSLKMQALILAELAQPEQKLVGFVRNDGEAYWIHDSPPPGTDLYTTPPKREWVGLTDEDLVACSEAQKATVIYFLAKLKKKNT